jgi:regulation of enolase protein 1 (concanavalin A-like superfamily)
MPQLSRVLVCAGAILISAAGSASAQALPSPWVSDDIGKVGVAGWATHSDGVFTVHASGTDIWRAEDSFHFAYVELPYDGYLEARVAAVSGEEAWAKAGVMVRRSLAANSAHYSMFATPGNGVVHQFRQTDGAISYSWSMSPHGLTQAPFWVQIRRMGQFVNVRTSQDRINWIGLGGGDWGLGPIYVGFAVTAHDYWGSASGTFDNVTLNVGPQNQPSQVEIVQPSEGTVFQAPASVPVTINASDPDYGIEQVELLVETAQGWSTFANWRSSDGYTSPYRYTFRNLEPGTYRIMGRVLDRQWGITDSAPVTFRVTDGSLSGEWFSADVGATGAQGSFADGDPIVVKGAGADIWDRTDAFHYAYQQVTGDWEFVGRVASVETVHRWTKAGLMLRESLDPGSKHVSLFTSPQGIAFQRRLTQGGLSVHTAGPTMYWPTWVRLVRRGSTIAAYVRRQPQQGWQLVASQTIDMPETIYAGLAVTSHVAGTLATATFDHVVSDARPAWTGRDIGAVAAAGSDADELVRHTVSGSGADIWGTADEFRFASRTWNGDGTLIARVASIEDTYPWAKAGVMFRESLDANARFVAVVVTPSRGIALQWRSTTGAAAQNITFTSLTAPRWIRLTRTGNTFSSAVSDDGLTWATTSGIAVTMAASTQVGLAVTSHADGIVAKAVFEALSIER